MFSRSDFVFNHHRKAISFAKDKDVNVMHLTLNMGFMESKVILISEYHSQHVREKRVSQAVSRSRIQQIRQEARVTNLLPSKPGSLKDIEIKELFLKLLEICIVSGELSQNLKFRQASTSNSHFPEPTSFVPCGSLTSPRVFGGKVTVSLIFPPTRRQSVRIGPRIES